MKFGVVLKSILNALSRLFYMRIGYTVPEGYDFSNAKHPQEKMMWEFSVLSWQVLVEPSPASSKRGGGDNDN